VPDVDREKEAFAGALAANIRDIDRLIVSMDPDEVR
jgi:hypothetical protein